MGLIQESMNFPITPYPWMKGKENKFLSSRADPLRYIIIIDPILNYFTLSNPSPIS
jgi:hypothetical protein